MAQGASATVSCRGEHPPLSAPRYRVRAARRSRLPPSPGARKSRAHSEAVRVVASARARPRARGSIPGASAQPDRGSHRVAGPPWPLAHRRRGRVAPAPWVCWVGPRWARTRDRGGRHELRLLRLERGALARDGLALGRNLLALPADLQSGDRGGGPSRGTGAAAQAARSHASAPGAARARLLLDLRHALHVDAHALLLRAHHHPRAGALARRARAAAQPGDAQRRVGRGESHVYFWDATHGRRDAKVNRANCNAVTALRGTGRMKQQMAQTACWRSVRATPPCQLSAAPSYYLPPPRVVRPPHPTQKPGPSPP